MGCQHLEKVQNNVAHLVTSEGASEGLPGCAAILAPAPGCSGKRSGPGRMVVPAAAGERGKPRWGRGMEAGVPEEPPDILTGVGGSRSRTQSPWRGSGTSLHRLLLSAAAAGQGDAVACPGFDSAADESSSGAFGCLGVHRSLWGRIPPQRQVSSDACPSLANVLGVGRLAQTCVWGGSSRGLGCCGCAPALHLCTARVAKPLWGHGGLRALGLLVVLLSLHVHGGRGGTFPPDSERSCGAGALSLALLAFGMGDACDCELRYA